MRSSRRTFYLLCAALFAALSSSSVGAKPPPLYLYPSEYRFSDGRILNSPQVLSAKQATANVLAIPELSGLVLLIYWSTLCPAENQCNFSLIDEVERYWRKQDKKIILSIATIGYPIQLGTTDTEIISATPDWVLRKIKTYSFPTKVLGRKDFDIKTVSATFPDFRDITFISLQAELINNLADKYDGNYTISQIRIGTGLMGEDNPMVGPISSPAEWYRESAWIAYCKRITDIYLKAFSRTELEFDISRLPWIKAVGTEADSEAVDELITYLRRRKVFLAFNGLTADGLGLYRNRDQSARNGVTQALHYIAEYKKSGGRVGLEAYGHITNERMGKDSPSASYRIAQLVADIGPDRLVFFSDIATKETMSGEPLSRHRLFKYLGY